MRILELKVNTLMRLCAAEKESDRRQIREEVRRLLVSQVPDSGCNPEALIRQILLELGSPDHLLGHAYVVEGILLVVEDRTYIDSITFGLYPQLAAKFDTTASRVERAIRHLVEVTWSRGDLDVLGRYFGNTISLDKGKPTNGEFIARLSNVVKQRMKDAA